jgi:hypothetical protein
MQILRPSIVAELGRQCESQPLLREHCRVWNSQKNKTSGVPAYIHLDFSRGMALVPVGQYRKILTPISGCLQLRVRAFRGAGGLHS